MLSGLFKFAQPVLFGLDPERAHELTLRSLECNLLPRSEAAFDPSLRTTVWDLSFPNPLGIAAGLDKDARVPNAVLRLGFGLTEVGTTTPKPQQGNPAPRVYRLVADRGVINRLGFNNEGHAAALARLEADPPIGIIGVNIGANKDSKDRVADYVAGIETFYDVASYFTVNISSPNTPGLRDLQAPDALSVLLARVLAARDTEMAKGKPKRPIIVKVAPDMLAEELAPLAATFVAHQVDGIAISNTTIARENLVSKDQNQEGGLSGRPLFHRSTVMLARMYVETGGRIPLIGIGGIDSAEAALQKIEAGATLLQLYTGLIYEGPGLVGQILSGLTRAANEHGHGSLQALVGTKASDWAAR